MQTSILEAKNIPSLRFVPNVLRTVDVPHWNVCQQLGQHFSIDVHTGALKFNGNKITVSFQASLHTPPVQANIVFSVLHNGSLSSPVVIANVSDVTTVESGFLPITLSRNDTLQLAGMSDGMATVNFKDIKLVIQPLP